MNRFFAALWLFLFPLLAMADTSTTSSLSFTPPVTDYSVIFLGNIFGLVDGVLYGTGSQIMGAIFTVFNSAVLALGGIVIMYTLIVGTMNTAHEGEMLGKKWSSIWIPVRSTMGLALLIPKASGYCLMQIFVMWVVVQGVGAADKVWAAALDYLNKGGVIIQSTVAPMLAMTPDAVAVANGATSMLTGEVCMLGLQKQLEAQRQSYLSQGENGPCATGSSTGGYVVPVTSTQPTPQQTLCTQAVPDFLSQFDTSPVQQSVDAASQLAWTDIGNGLSDDATAKAYCSASAPGASTYSLPMPNLVGTPYAALTGICGTIQWSSFPPVPATCTSQKLTGHYTTGFFGNLKRTTTSTVYTITGTRGSEVQVTNNATRAAAVQSMYQYYMPIAQTIINNDPAINTSNTNTSPDYPNLASSAFGVPYLLGGGACITTNRSCITWGNDPSISASAPLLTGTEIGDGMSVYQAIMSSTVNMMNQIATESNATKNRNFIADANADGWMSAGSYFFDLVKLNDSGIISTQITDTNTGLDKSTVTPMQLLAAFPTDPEITVCNASNGSSALFVCQLFDVSIAPIETLVDLIDNSSAAAVSMPAIPITPSTTATTNRAASTVYGFITNALILQASSNPNSAPTFNLNSQPKPQSNNYSFPKLTFGHGNVWNLKDLGRTIFTGFYNDLVRPIVNGLMSIFYGVINDLIIACVYTPIQIMSGIFLSGVGLLTDNPSMNPIVQLAKMGNSYINQSTDMWLKIVFLSVASLGLFTPIIAMCMPLVMAWMGVMITIGFVTAYYVPFLPYMIFTFGVIAWLTAVIEAMVAAPIVALGVTHPEGEGVMGNKGEQALMILMNVFLRPAMMIIGYIAAIALSYVAVWIINTGFSHVMSFTQGANYQGWAGVYGFFFSILIYTTIYMTVVEQSFNLIHQLPDKVLRWIGVSPESTGEAAAGWAKEGKEQIKGAGDKTAAGGLEASKKAGGAGVSLYKKLSGGAESSKDPSVSGEGSM